MAPDKSRILPKEAILAALAKADEYAIAHEGALTPSVADWSPRVQVLLEPKCAKSYLPVLCVLLTARVLKPQSELEVLAVGAAASDRGYSSQSVGKYLMKFAKAHDINLRTTTSQPMNSQPFTNEPRIVADMSGPQYKTWYDKFFETACLVEGLSQQQALEVLAHIIHIRRGVGIHSGPKLSVSADLATMRVFAKKTAAFVDEYRLRGKVGQAFAAALYDGLYGAENVRMGKNHDPSFTHAGDVQVGADSHFWLMAEVKQASISTADVKAFVERVHDQGGRRVAYFALRNGHYAETLSVKETSKIAERLKIELALYESPLEALEDLLPKTPGSFDEVASSLANRMAARLLEAEVEDEVLAVWKKLVESLEA